VSKKTDNKRSVIKNKPLRERIFLQAELDKKPLPKWINEWGDFESHREVVKNGFITSFGKGYKQAFRDLTRKLKIIGIDYKEYLDEK